MDSSGPIQNNHYSTHRPYGAYAKHGLVAHDDLDVFGPKCMRPTEAPCRAWGIRLTIMKLNRNVTQSNSQNVGVSVGVFFILIGFRIILDAPGNRIRTTSGIKLASIPIQAF